MPVVVVVNTFRYILVLGRLNEPYRVKDQTDQGCPLFTFEVQAEPLLDVNRKNESNKQKITCVCVIYLYFLLSFSRIVLMRATEYI